VLISRITSLISRTELQRRQILKWGAKSWDNKEVVPSLEELLGR